MIWAAFLSIGETALAAKSLARQQLVLRRGDPVGDAVDRIVLVVDLELAHDLLEQALGVVLVVDGEVAREAQPIAIGAQHPHAHRVEREHPHRAHARSDERAEPLAHLGGGLVGEGDGEYLGGADAQVAHEVGDAEGQHARLARAGAREHQKRAVDGLDGFALRGVQGGEIECHRRR